MYKLDYVKEYQKVDNYIRSNNLLGCGQVLHTTRYISFINTNYCVTVTTRGKLTTNIITEKNGKLNYS